MQIFPSILLLATIAVSSVVYARDAPAPAAVPSTDNWTWQVGFLYCGQDRSCHRGLDRFRDNHCQAMTTADCLRQTVASCRAARLDMYGECRNYLITGKTRRRPRPPFAVCPPPMVPMRKVFPTLRSLQLSPPSPPLPRRHLAPPPPPRQQPRSVAPCAVAGSVTRLYLPLEVTLGERIVCLCHGDDLEF